MEEYSVNKKNIIEHLWILSISIIGFGGGMIYGVYRLGEEEIKLVFIISFSVILVLGILTLILHFQYYLIDRNTKLKIDLQNSILIYIRKEKTIKFELNDIDYVVRVKGIEFAEGRSSFWPWGLFNFSVIYLNDGTRIVITSYLVVDLTLPISESKIRVQKVFYPLIG